MAKRTTYKKKAKKAAAKQGKDGGSDSEPEAKKAKTGPPKKDGDSDLELEGTGTSDAVSWAVQKELEAIRAAKEEEDLLPPESDPDKEDDEEPQPAEEDKPDEGAAADPYLLADAHYIQKDLRWRNKQRTLVFASRGVTARFRHLCEDVKKLLPHHKPEPKFDKRASLHEINEICELKSCNNAIFFEGRKGKDLYMYMARVPTGPTIKFQVHNIHTTAEVRLAGNCLLGSRPVLYFDDNFNHSSFLKLIKEMIIQTMGTPRNHPKSKPFHDHVMSFYYLDRKIWFRHYQINPETPDFVDDPERQQLTEIGPRMVLEPMRIMSGSFAGNTLYLNPYYWSPTKLRAFHNRQKAMPYVRRMEKKEALEEFKKENQAPEDPTEDVFK